MKTIKERAKEYAVKCPGCKNAEWGFIAGAQSEREELLRWHDPKEELPEEGAVVLGKIADEGTAYYTILHYDIFGWWVRPTPLESWAGCPYDVMKWRYIHE